MQRIAQEIVHSVGVKLSRDQAAPKQRISCFRLAFKQICNVVCRKPPVCTVEGMAFDCPGELASDNLSGIVLVLVPFILFRVPKRKKLLSRMRKWAMTDIVK